MPHPLPDDIDNVSGLKWFLAAVPDDPAFTRAAWDVFTELANYWKWGMEGPVPEDSDKAAQLWSTAVYETIEAYQMGFPDVLLGYIDEIEGLLRSLELISCCGDTSVTGDTVTSDITPDVGDPPTEWGDGEVVSDWEDWRQLVCGASDAWVTHLKSQVDDIETYLDAGLLVIGVVTALLAAGAGAGILIAIKYSVAVEAFAAILANANNLVFQNIQNGIESARADIRCAIFDGCEDLETVIEGAVGALAWSSWYQFYDWCSIRNSLLEGQFNGGFHAVNRSELCACEGTPISGATGIASEVIAKTGTNPNNAFLFLESTTAVGLRCGNTQGCDVGERTCGAGQTAIGAFTADCTEFLWTSPDNVVPDSCEFWLRNATGGESRNIGGTLEIIQYWDGSAWQDVASLTVVNAPAGTSVSGRQITWTPATVAGGGDLPRVEVVINT